MSLQGADQGRVGGDVVRVPRTSNTEPLCSSITGLVPTAAATNPRPLVVIGRVRGDQDVGFRRGVRRNGLHQSTPQATQRVAASAARSAARLRLNTVGRHRSGIDVGRLRRARITRAANGVDWTGEDGQHAAPLRDPTSWPATGGAGRRSRLMPGDHRSAGLSRQPRRPQGSVGPAPPAFWSPWWQDAVEVRGCSSTS